MSRGKKTRLLRAMPMTFTSSTRCHASSGSDSGGPMARMPTLFMTTSTRPKAARQLSRRASRSASRDTSAGTAMAAPPAASIWAGTSFSRSSRRSPTTILAPRRAKESAVARPIPLPPPVMTAAAPARSNGCVMRWPPLWGAGIPTGPPAPPLARVAGDAPPGEGPLAPDHRIGAVDVDAAGLQLDGHPVDAIHVLGPEIGGEAGGSAVGDLDSLFLCREAQQGKNRAKDFDLRQLARWVDVPEDSGLDVEPPRGFTARDTAADEQLARTVRLGPLDHAEDLLLRRLRDDGAEDGARLERVTGRHVARNLDDLRGHLVVDVLVHEHPRWDRAALTGQNAAHAE